MALYTGKGDSGSTKLFTTPSGERLSKSSNVFETLGSIDELNSFLGICKVRVQDMDLQLGETGPTLDHIVHHIQKDLFIIQAEVAGADKSIVYDKVAEMEHMIGYMENQMPPIQSFFISGGTEIATLFDTARTLARRAERRLVTSIELGEVIVSNHTRAYMNRLSSILYAMARYSNHELEAIEYMPDYE